MKAIRVCGARQHRTRLLLALVFWAGGGGSLARGQGEKLDESASVASETAFSWLREVLPSYFFDLRFLDLELWQWIGLLLLVVVASFLGFIASSVLMGGARSLVRRTKTTWDDALLSAAVGPLRLLLSVALFYIASFVLDLGAEGRSFVNTACEVLVVLAIMWLALRLIDNFGSLVHEAFAAQDPSAANTLVPMGRRVTKTIVIVIAVISLIHNLGFNVAGILTGLGVGGLAVALAAQKTFENFFGGITVVADRPIKVGDFCRVGDHIGTVEDIGLRSTRIRSLDRTVVSIPNSEFSTSRIENFGKRDKMRLHTMLQVGYNTSPDQMRYLLIELRRMLYAHPKTLPDPCRARFVNFGAHCLDIEVFVFIETRDWNEFLAIREDIYLRILDIVTQSGTYFAYPSQTLYLGRDQGRDLERTEEVEKIVQEWRKSCRLPLPNFPEDLVADIKDTLDYPPRGSVLATDVR